MAALRAEVGEALSSKSRLGVMGLGAVEKIQVGGVWWSSVGGDGTRVEGCAGMWAGASRT